MSSNSRLDTTIALKITKQLPTYLTNFVQYPGASIISFMKGEDAAFGEKTSIDGIRHPEEEITISSEIEYNYKYARKYARRMDMPSITDAIMIEEEYYAGDLVNAMGHVSDLGANFIEGINLFAMDGALKPLMYGLADYPNATAGTRERPEMCAPVTALGPWDVASNVPPTLADMETELTLNKFYGQKIIIAHPIIKPFLSLILTNTATPVGTWMQSAYGYPIIFSPWTDITTTTSSTYVYMVDVSMFSYTMTPIRIKTYFENSTDDWVWKWQTRMVIRPKPLYETTTPQWMKGIVRTDIDVTT